MADQGVMIDQGIVGDATATSAQDSAIDSGTGTTDATDAAAADATVLPGGDLAAEDLGGGALPEVPLPDGSLPDVEVPDPSSLLSGNLLNVDVNLAADADLAAPINGAVAANANVAAPIDAAVAANIGSIDSDAVAVAQQDAIINQSIEGEAT